MQILKMSPIPSSPLKLSRCETSPAALAIPLRLSTAQDSYEKPTPRNSSHGLAIDLPCASLTTRKPPAERYPDFIKKLEDSYYATPKYVRSKIKTLVELHYFSKAYFLMLGMKNIDFDSEMIRLRANCKLAMGRPWESFEDVELCLSMNPDDTSALALKKDFQICDQEAVELAHGYEKDNACRNERQGDLIASGFILMGKLDKAKDAAVRFSTMYPNDMNLPTYVIDCNVMSGCLENALMLANEAIQKNPFSCVLYDARSQVYEKMGRLDKAWEDAIYAEGLPS